MEEDMHKQVPHSGLDAGMCDIIKHACARAHTHTHIYIYIYANLHVDSILYYIYISSYT